MQTYNVIIQPEGREVKVLEGSTIMEAMNDAGVDFDFPCGGRSTCGKCRVRVVNGLGKPTAQEMGMLAENEIEQGIRLACQTRVYEDITVEVTNRKLHHNILIASEERAFRVEPHLNKIFIEVDKPSLDNQRSDWHRLKDSLAKFGYNRVEQEVPLPLLRQLPEAIREARNQLTAIMYGNKVVAMERQDTSDIMFGMAFDIGTTSIVGYLLDLFSGQELTVVSTLNPQTKYGADVISRVNFVAREEGGLDKLHTIVIEAINRLIEEAAQKTGIGKSSIYAITVAANTCMHHLFLGISPRNVAISPYVSAFSELVVLNAIELHVDINKAGKVFVLPNIAGFVGADTTAVLLAVKLNQSEDIKLIIDIGTNGEIVLGSKDKMVACSAAAGPAFEGAQISSGMRGAVGAIDHLTFGDEIEYSVIGGESPIGICGSALLDAVAGLLELGIIDKRGKLLSADKIANTAAKEYKENIVQHEGQAAFLLVDASKTGHGRAIVVTQSDIRELQMAKGAMAAGVKVLMEILGVEVGDIKEVLLAGAFGNYLNPHSACIIGLIPLELENRIKMVGNAAGTGAKLALLSSGEYQKAGDLARSVNFVELGSYPKFNSIFSRATYFNVN